MTGLLAKVELICAVQKDYPHQLSGGMKQRVMLAMALAGKPRLIIADEPTTGLDASIARRILDLFKKIRREDELTMLFITHDIGAAAYLCDDIALMYKGRLVERADKISFFHNCRHPYSRDLLACMPQRHCNKAKIRGAVLEHPPAYEDADTACPYYGRCRFGKPICKQQQPVWQQISSTHEVCCWIRDKRYG